MAREKENFGNRITELFKRNSKTFTFLAVITILTVGVTIVDNPGKWWVSVVAMAMFGVIIILFMDARVFIKAALSFFVLLFEASWAFKVGALADYTGMGGSIWMLSTLFGFFIVLALSYVIPNKKGRWGTITLTTTVGYLITYITASLGMPLGWAAVISTVINIALFLVLYMYGIRTSYKYDDMPEVGMSEDTMNKMVDRLLNSGWGAVPINGRIRNGVLVWNDQHAFVLTTINMKQKFGIGGNKRKTYLTFNSKNINPWLTDIVYQLTPTWRTKGADIMVVLLDKNNGNGYEHKTIGVEVPDSRGKIPVGIIPAKDLLANKRYTQLMTKVEKEFNPFVKELSSRQARALDYKLPKSEDEEEIEESSKTEEEN